MQRTVAFVKLGNLQCAQFNAGERKLVQRVLQARAFLLYCCGSLQDRQTIKPRAVALVQRVALQLAQLLAGHRELIDLVEDGLLLAHHHSFALQRPDAFLQRAQRGVELAQFATLQRAGVARVFELKNAVQHVGCLLGKCIAQVADGVSSIAHRLWHAVDDFVKRGIGFAGLEQGCVVARRVIRGLAQLGN